MLMSRLVCALLCCVGWLSGHADGLDRVRERGELVCGVEPGVHGFAVMGGDGRWEGMDIDICRAVAAAIFGSAARVRIVQSTKMSVFADSDEIDLVSRRLSWSLAREAKFDIRFGPVTFYDGQGFLVRGRNLRRVQSLSGVRICVHGAEDATRPLVRYFHDHHLRLRLLELQDRDSARAAFVAGKCDVLSDHVSDLAAFRSQYPDRLRSWRILPELITREPLAPITRAEDERLLTLVQWALYAMLYAEERAITSERASRAAQGDEPLFPEVWQGTAIALGLARDWPAAVVREVGNYGEMFDRNIGARSALRLDRGLNRLWSDGGLMYPPLLH